MMTTDVAFDVNRFGYVDTADVARIIRADLKRRFPGTKFSVTISRYSGGSSIRVRWTDGPTSAMVEAVYGHLHAYDFDGMTDSTVSRGPVSINGQLVRLGNGYISFTRDVSPALLERARAFSFRKYGPVVLTWGRNGAMDIASRAVLHDNGAFAVYAPYTDFSDMASV